MKGQCIGEEERGAIDFIEFMAAGATSKTIATCIAYPHGQYNVLLKLKDICTENPLATSVCFSAGYS